MKYKMVTFCNRGYEDHPIWCVYGIIGPYENDWLGDYETREDAELRSGQFFVPIMQGATNSLSVLEKLGEL